MATIQNYLVFAWRCKDNSVVTLWWQSAC